MWFAEGKSQRSSQKLCRREKKGRAGVANSLGNWKDSGFLILLGEKGAILVLKRGGKSGS